MISKVDHDIGLVNTIDQLVTNQSAGFPQTQALADVPTNDGMSGDFHSTYYLYIFHRRDKTDNPATHSSASSGYDDFSHNIISLKFIWQKYYLIRP
jgi:hypothetical protein